MKPVTRHFFLGAEALLYLAFLSMDLLRLGDTTALKFLSICLVALMGLLYARRAELRTAFVLTAFADLFLLVLDRHYPIGIALFFIVQTCYALYLDPPKGLIPRIVCVLSVTILFLFLKIGTLESLALGYITLFLCNLVRAGFKAKQQPLFFLGLLLFFCCDLCVGMYQISAGALYQFARIAMWGFYLPGQVLILLSTAQLGGNHS